MLQKQNKIKDAFFFILLFIILAFSYFIFRPFLQVILLSIFIVVVVYPVHLKLKAKIGQNTLSAIFSTFLMLLFVIIPASFLIIILTNEVIDLYPQVIKALSETKTFDLNSYIQNIPILPDIYETIKNSLEVSNVDMNLDEMVKNILGSVANYAMEKGKGLFINIGLFLIDLVLMTITIFFLFKDGDYFYEKLYGLIPLYDKEKDFLFFQLKNAIQAIFLGSIITGAVQAFLSYMAYLFIGLNFSLLWAFITFLTSFMLLSALVWLPIGVYAFFANGVLMGIIFALWCILVISSADSIIRPLVIGEKTKIHAIILLFAILGGLAFFGFIGVFLAPLIVVLLGNLFIIYNERYQGKPPEEIMIVELVEPGPEG
jgi:predicted PurR-regulated permease PerM